MGIFSDYGRASADLSQQEANRRALAVQQRGQLWGGTIASLSQLPLQIRQQQDQEKRTAIADRRATQEGALTDIKLDQARREIVADDQIKKILATSTPYEAVTKLRAIDPERAVKLEKANAEYVVDTIRRVPPGTPGSAIAPKLQPFMSSDEIKLLPETIDAPFQRSTVLNYLDPKSWADVTKTTPKPDYTIGDQRFSGETNQVLATGIPKSGSTPNPNEASLAAAAAAGDVNAKKALDLLRAQHPPAPSASADNKLWVLRDNKPVRIAESDYRQGDLPMPSTTARETSEDERKTAGFYAQMSQAIKTMDEVESKLSEKELYQIQSLPQEGLIGMANRGELSENAKRYLRAFEQFTEARLRPVSGAAISDSEFARDRRTYARQFSESLGIAKDRKAARQTALETLKTRAGRAFTQPTDGADGGEAWVPAGNGIEIRRKGTP